MCTLTPANPLTIASGGTTNLTATINIPNDASAGQYNLKINTQDTAGAPSHSSTISLTVAQDFIVTSSTSSQTVSAGQTSGAYALRVLPVGSSFKGAVSLACTAPLRSTVHIQSSNPSDARHFRRGCRDEHLHPSEERRIAYAGPSEFYCTRAVAAIRYSIQRWCVGKPVFDPKEELAIAGLCACLPHDDVVCLVRRRE